MTCKNISLKLVIIYIHVFILLGHLLLHTYGEKKTNAHAHVHVYTYLLNERLGELQHSAEIGKCNFRFEHPKLRQVRACVRPLRSVSKNAFREHVLQKSSKPNKKQPAKKTNKKQTKIIINKTNTHTRMHAHTHDTCTHTHNGIFIPESGAKCKHTRQCAGEQLGLQLARAGEERVAAGAEEVVGAHHRRRRCLLLCSLLRGPYEKKYICNKRGKGGRHFLMRDTKRELWDFSCETQRGYRCCARINWCFVKREFSCCSLESDFCYA